MKTKVYEFIKSHFAFFVGIAIFIAIVSGGWLAESQPKVVTSESTDYILNYGVDSVNHIGFTAAKTKCDIYENIVTYYVDDGSRIYVVDGVIMWLHMDGVVDCYANGFITAH